MKRLLRRLHLALIRRGIEFGYHDIEHLVPHAPLRGSVSRELVIVINHRFYCFALAVDIDRGVFADELNTPHAEIAAEYERGERALA